MGTETEVQERKWSLLRSGNSGNLSDLIVVILNQRHLLYREVPRAVCRSQEFLTTLEVSLNFVPQWRIGESRHRATAFLTKVGGRAFQEAVGRCGVKVDLYTEPMRR